MGVASFVGNELMLTVRGCGGHMGEKSGEDLAHVAVLSRMRCVGAGRDMCSCHQIDTDE